MKNLDSLLKGYKPSEQELKRIEFLDIVMKDKNLNEKIQSFAILIFKRFC